MNASCLQASGGMIVLLPPYDQPNCFVVTNKLYNDVEASLIDVVASVSQSSDTLAKSVDIFAKTQEFLAVRLMETVKLKGDKKAARVWAAALLRHSLLEFLRVTVDANFKIEAVRQVSAGIFAEINEVHG